MKLDFCEVFDDYTSRCRKIPKEKYLSNGKYIVIDQGQNNIAGYTNTDDGLFEDVPAIVFGDHTRIIKYVDEPFFLGADGVKLLKSKIKDANYKYLYYALRNARIPDTGYNRHFKWLKEINLEYKDAESQKNIVKTLDTVTNIIELYKVELSKLDNLIRARFVEMFVSKNYPREELDNLSYGKGEYGAQSASVEYNSSRPRYVRITDIKEDGSLNDDVVCSANVEDDELYKLEYGDFCFARMGATVGKTYAYRGGNQIFAGYLIRYKLNLNRIIPEYLYEFTRLHEYRNWVSLNQSGAAQPGINAKKYGSLRIPVAPLEEQRVFAKFVGQVDKSKFEVQKALDKAQLLFDSLMQKYFG